MGQGPLRVGIVGLQPVRGWGLTAHLPALRALPDDYEIVGVTNSHADSSRAAAKAFGLAHAFATVDDMVESRDVDLVVVTVKVPHHSRIVATALRHGKHVYCEWPLGNGLREAQELADLARASGVRAVIGTQARVAPEVLYLRELLAEGYVGDVLSTTITGMGRSWGPQTDRANAYLYDHANGATLLTIPLGHTLAAFRDVLGPIGEVAAVTATRRSSVHVSDTGEDLPVTSPDQILVSAVTTSGVPVSIHYRGGLSRGTGFAWEINGTEGDVRVTSVNGHSQLSQLSVEGGRGEEKNMTPMPLPARYAADAADGPVVGNVRRVYRALAADLRADTTTAPTFDDAVETHRVLAAIEQAAASGQRSRPDHL